MIEFTKLELNKEQYRLDFLLAKPFSYLIIDDFCDPVKIHSLHSQIPEITTKSRDYMFAENKFEKSRIREISPLFEELYADLTSDRFRHFLQFITNQQVFVDEAMHGGGIHQGKEKSFLDMHLDFNYHPIHKDWYRYLNLLFYLNKDWKPAYGGHLTIEDLRTGQRKELDVPFNRMILQLTCNYTLHGYSKTNFPAGTYRTSIASYAYMLHKDKVEKPRTTDWRPPQDQHLKRFFASVYDPAVKIKNKLFGSSTAKN